MILNENLEKIKKRVELIQNIYLIIQIIVLIQKKLNSEN
jgi:hypothetical protein